MSDSLQSHGLKHTRLSYPLLSPRTCSDSCPLSQWCHPTISSSVVLLLLLPSIFPCLRVFSNEALFALSGQSIGTSASASVFPMSEYSGLISFRIDRFDLLALQGTLKRLLQHHNSETSILRHLWSNSHILFIFIFLKKNLLGMPWGLWDPCSLARDWIWALISERVPTTGLPGNSLSWLFS